MSVKKKQTTSAPKWCIQMQLFNWEPVIYLDFNTAYRLMLEYMKAEECIPNLSRLEIENRLDNEFVRYCKVEGLRGGEKKTDVEVYFRKLSLVTEVGDEN